MSACKVIMLQLRETSIFMHTIDLLLQSECVSESFSKWLRLNFEPLISRPPPFFNHFTPYCRWPQSTHSPVEDLKSRALSYLIFQVSLNVPRWHSGTINLKKRFLWKAATVQRFLIETRGTSSDSLRSLNIWRLQWAFKLYNFSYTFLQLTS